MASEPQNGMTPLSKEEASVFERRLAMAQQQLAEIDSAIEVELDHARRRILALQEQRAAPLKMYGAACTMLGIRNAYEDPDA